MAGPAERAFTSTDGVTAVAYDHGGSGPAVVFCHATGFHGRMWDPICARLAHRYRCIALDFRGHGDSVIPPGIDLAWTGMAQDLLTLLDAFSLDGVRAVGHSMGAASILLAEHVRPGAFERAWLCEPIVFPSTSGTGATRLVDSARRRRQVFASRQAAFDRYASRPPFDRAAPDMLRAYVDHGFRDLPDGSVTLKCPGEIEAAVFANSAHDGFDALGTIATAATVVGSGDGDGPADLAPLVAEHLPHARYVRFGDLTHFAPLEDPDAITASILEALDP